MAGGKGVRGRGYDGGSTANERRKRETKKERDGRRALGIRIEGRGLRGFDHPDADLDCRLRVEADRDVSECRHQ